jgi:hypothetical protein
MHNMRRLHRSACALIASYVAMAAAPAGSEDNAAATPEVRATTYLAAEVPKWYRENKCFSCHNNGDAARALMLAQSRGLRKDRAPLKETLDFLRAIETWDENGPEGPFKDRKLARIQFGAALTEARAAGMSVDFFRMQQAARMVAELQQPDGSWPSDAPGTIGSPVTYGQPLATAIALRTLLAAKDETLLAAVERGEAWFETREPKNVLDAAATLITLHSHGTRSAITRCDEALAIIEKGQSSDGGWGPNVSSPPEVIDTAIVFIALASQRDKFAAQIAAGRKYLLAQQLPDGSWPATTRPTGADSYAQKLSTTGWALQALFVSK